MKKLLVVLMVLNVIFQVMYHEVWEIKKGQNVGQLGSLVYLLDDSGYRMSEGYHQIIVRPDGKYDAELGSMKYVLSSDGRKE